MKLSIAQLLETKPRGMNVDILVGRYVWKVQSAEASYCRSLDLNDEIIERGGVHRMLQN